MSKTLQNIQNIQEALASFIRNYLEQNNLTQQELVDQINAFFSKKVLSQPQLNKLIAKKSIPRSYTFFLLCDFFQIHSSEIFSITESPAKIYQKKTCLETKNEFISSLQMHLKDTIEKRASEYKHSKDYQSNTWLAKKMTEEFQKQDPEFPSINSNTLYRYRNKGRDLPLDFLFALCRVLKIEASDLID